MSITPFDKALVPLLVAVVFGGLLYFHLIGLNVFNVVIGFVVSALGVYFATNK